MGTLSQNNYICLTTKRCSCTCRSCTIKCARVMYTVHDLRPNCKLKGKGDHKVRIKAKEEGLVGLVEVHT